MSTLLYLKLDYIIDKAVTDQQGTFLVICVQICECEYAHGPVLNKVGLFDFNAFHNKHAKVSKACFLLRLQKASLCVY